MLWNAATIIPLPGSDGTTALDAAVNIRLVTTVASGVAVVFVVRLKSIPLACK